MRSYYLSFFLAGVLLQGSLARTSETAPAQIKRARWPLPPRHRQGGEGCRYDDKGNITVLRERSNDFARFRGHPGEVGDVAMCAVADAPSMRRLNDAMPRTPPTNTQLGPATCWPEAQAGAAAIPPPRQALRSKNRQIRWPCGPSTPPAQVF